ncbi:MAG: class I SAM-dependent methyltransferase [Polyangiales bacterium]
MLLRVLEPEAMDTAEEAVAYDAMDHGEVNARFCDDLITALEALTGAAHKAIRVVDIGTGTARIPIVLCQKLTECRVVATDLAQHMLDVAKKNVADAGLLGQIELVLNDAKESRLLPASFDVVLSNSVIHHIPDPQGALSEMRSLVKPGGLLFLRDLERPSDDESVRRLVARHGAHETDRARDLFEASLRAALTLEEVVAMAAKLAIPASSVQRTSDRHWTLCFRNSRSV